MRTSTVLASFALSLVACGSGETPAPAGSSSAAEQAALAVSDPGAMPADAIHAPLRGDASDPHADVGMLPSPHEIGAGGEGGYSGTIRLRGPHAVPQNACLFVSVMPRGSRRPLCSTKIRLEDPNLGDTTEAGRAIPFSVDNCTAFDGELELQVWFDLDGYVDTKEEGSLIRSFPIGAGGIDVTLEPE